MAPETPNLILHEQTQLGFKKKKIKTYGGRGEGVSKLRAVNSEARDVACGGWGMTCQMLHLTGQTVTRSQV